MKKILRSLCRWRDAALVTLPFVALFVSLPGATNETWEAIGIWFVGVIIFTLVIEILVFIFLHPGRKGQ